VTVGDPSVSSWKGSNFRVGRFAPVVFRLRSGVRDRRQGFPLRFVQDFRFESRRRLQADIRQQTVCRLRAKRSERTVVWLSIVIPIGRRYTCSTASTPSVRRLWRARVG